MTPEEACRKYEAADHLVVEPEFHWKHDAIRFFAIVGPLFVISFTIGYFGSEILNAMDLQWFDVGLK